MQEEGKNYMRISTKGRYALRLMLDLALNDTGEPVRIRDISERQGISNKYLEQIISTLTKAGAVKSLRGPQGGYRLAKNPEQYTVGMILRLMEGSLSPVACLDDEENTCPKESECITILLWKKLDDAIKGVVDTITLGDLVEWHRNKAGDYVI
jgi:Rrf2 family protein